MCFSSTSVQFVLSVHLQDDNAFWFEDMIDYMLYFASLLCLWFPNRTQKCVAGDFIWVGQNILTVIKKKRKKNLLKSMGNDNAKSNNKKKSALKSIKWH